MSRLAKLALVLAGLLAVAAVAWMLFLPAVVEHELREVTGFEFRVAVISANPFTGRVVVRGLSARNPAGYPSPDFVELHTLDAEVSVFSCMTSGRIVVDDLSLDIEKIVLVRQHDGTTNAGAFMAAFRHGGGTGGSAGAASAPAKPMRYLIHKLHLKLGQLAVADYSGSKLDQKTYNVGIDETFIDVDGPGRLLVPSVLRNLHDFGLHHDVAQLLPGDFGKALAGAVGGAASVGSKLRDATVKTGDLLKGALDKLEEKAKP